MPLSITDTSVNEGSTCKLEFVLKDYNGNAIAVGNITGASFTLKDLRSGEVINNRDGILNGSDDVISSFDGSGNFSFTLVAADNVIKGANRSRRKQSFEEHIFTITISATVSGDNIVLQESISIKVANLKYKP